MGAHMRADVQGCTYENALLVTDKQRWRDSQEARLEVDMVISLQP